MILSSPIVNGIFKHKICSVDGILYNNINIVDVKCIVTIVGILEDVKQRNIVLIINNSSKQVKYAFLLNKKYYIRSTNYTKIYTRVCTHMYLRLLEVIGI